MNRTRFCLMSGLSSGLLYMVDKMAQMGQLDGVIIQQSPPAKNFQILMRRIARKIFNILRNPLKQLASPLDAYLPEFTKWHVMDKQVEDKLRLLADKYDFDLFITTLINTDVAIHDYLANTKTPYMLNLGGKILKPAILSCFKGIWINCHGGYLPYYRGLWSEYWAIKNKDVDRIGWTIHELVEQIDAGNIFEKGTIEIDPQETLEELMLRNYAAMITAYIHFAKALPDSTTQTELFETAKANYYSIPNTSTPGKLLRKRVGQL